jgi:hypothetical protein
MHIVLTFLVRIFIVAAGLVLAVSLAVAAILMFAIWGIRATWAKLTGRPVMPFVVRIDPRQGFGQMWRRDSQAASRTPRADSVRQVVRGGEVTDVEPRAPQPPR